MMHIRFVVCADAPAAENRLSVDDLLKLIDMAQEANLTAVVRKVIEELFVGLDQLYLGNPA